MFKLCRVDSHMACCPRVYYMGLIFKNEAILALLEITAGGAGTRHRYPHHKMHTQILGDLRLCHGKGQRAGAICNLGATVPLVVVLTPA